jgi:hypothetical protein
MNIPFEAETLINKNIIPKGFTSRVTGNKQLNK